MGFRANQSTIDNLYIVRQIIEKFHELNMELRHAFIDYSQAFDSVYRANVIEHPNKYGIPSKIINLLVKTLHNTKAKDKVNQACTANFEISTGVKQGDPLSATLFIIVIDYIIQWVSGLSRG